MNTRYQPIDASFFVQNRKRFTRDISPQAMAVFLANDPMPRSGDQTFPYRQNTHFFYLTGIDQEESALILFPDCPKQEYKEILFIRRTNEHLITWEGPKLTQEEAKTLSGIQTVLWMDQMEGIFYALMMQSQILYLNGNEQERFQNPVPSRDHRFAQKVRQEFPLHALARAQPILRNLVMIKAPQEVETMRTAIRITGDAFQRVCTSLRPGIMEFELEAEMIYEFIRQGARGHAYEPIVAGGANACILHYIQNNARLQDGDVVLLDFGAEYGNYAADLSRSIPVSGRFSSRQAQVYDAVLRTLRMAKQMMVPGQTLAEIQKESESYLGYELHALGLVNAKSPDKKDIQRYFMHGIGHHLGLDVHDLADRNLPLQAGMVITCEPGIYIREEGLGIRLENNILITDHQPQDLMAEIPIEREAIEELMNSMVKY
ncbi:MAG: aminopeptidase P N-terminal domain-containing protein [Lewinellaceae bacterium]|nr:aminopeptidase P N-terminal domain-containing protein [Lewinellaceae bacterium]HPR01434.1 aminopeptidase P N-terminal domain-containing protein [Saprospiraceae bacterium]HQU51542.1 aminopeptidase P N-terminal domain-containing protein [Saprospiraceae bacterium]